MLTVRLNKSLNAIMMTFLSYLPSRLLVVLNSLIIVPVLAHILSEKELGVFYLAIGVLNLVCTCSTDWIAKSALRFYEKYKGAGKLDEFFSNIIWLTLIMYLVIFAGYVLFSGVVEARFFIGKPVLLLTLFLVIPVGIRQFLYQMLRVLNRPFLYTFSIIIYQMSLLGLFLVFTDFLPNVFAALWAMGAAVFGIDIFIFKQIGLRLKFLDKINTEILAESLKYALPQIITNTSIWAILNINKFVFQYNQYFADAAAAGVSYFFVTSILTPLLSTFSFAIFPFVVKKYENKRKIKPYLTNSIRLYCALFIPVAALFCYFPREINKIAFADKFPGAFILLSFFAVSLFVHELMKLFNMKYHLENKTFVEMGVSLFFCFICLYLNFVLIGHFHLAGAGLAMLLSVLILFGMNLLIRFKNLDYVNYFAILKTVVMSVMITLAAYLPASLLFDTEFIYGGIIKIILYIFLCYLFSVLGLKRLLEG